MNDLVANSADAATPARSIEVITGEIQFYKRQAGSSFLEIGRRLTEAKEQLPHGEWLPWLRDQVDFSEVTAQRLMRLAKEYENPSPVTDLGLSKALALLALPASEREQFAAEVHTVDGGEKTVAEMSKRELEQAIRERDAAQQAAQAAENRAEGYRQKADIAAARITDLEQRVDELQRRPVDVAVESSDPAEIEAAVHEAVAKAKEASQKEIDALTKSIDQYKTVQERLSRKLKDAENKAAAAEQTAKTAAESAAAEAEQRAAAARAEAEQLRHELAMADPVTAEFKGLFEQVAAMVPKLLTLVDRAGEDTRPKLQAALAALGKQMAG